jgi:hypothetical protein
MHDSSVMPFVHLGLVAAVLVAVLGFVVIRAARARKVARRHDATAREVEDRTRG